MPVYHNFMIEYKKEVIARNEKRETNSEYKLTEEQINEIFLNAETNAKEVKDIINNLCNKRIWDCGKDIESLNSYYDMGNIRFSYREALAMLSEMMNLFTNGTVACSYITEKFIKTWRFLNHYDLVNHANKSIIESTIDKKVYQLERDKENDNTELIDRLRAINSSLRELL